MKSEFLHKDNTGRLIIIFAGWSTEPNFYRHISLPGWDLIVAYDYSDLDFDKSVMNGYHTVALFAWSLGVFAASMVIPADRLALAVAINGTESPVDDEFGIPVNIFNGTAQTLNERNLKKFRRRMFGNPSADHTLGLNETPLALAEAPMALAEAKDDIDHLRSQLEFIACISKNNSKYSDISSPEDSDINPSQYSAKNSSNGNINWNRVYISENDQIFPPKSQRKAWEMHPSNPEIVALDEPHYVDLYRIIKSALPAKESVGKLFHKALSTYDNQAIAQRTIAEHLTDFPGGVPLSPKKVLEIGPGSGVFTKLFANRFHPDRMDFVELYPLPSFNIATEENYFVADAEDWVAQEALANPGTYDAIISASALQWFANPDSFFRNAAKLLCPGGGFMLCSTFVPGNLKEMESVNPYGLIYRPIDEMEYIVQKYFMFSKLEEEELIVGFDSPQQTLRHLKETGVGGGISTGRSPRQLLGSTPLILTYRPLYIYAVTSPSPPS